MLTGTVTVGNVSIGGNTPVKVQTMCNTFTQDIEKSVAQCVDMVAAGADLIRLTTQGMKEVEALKEIKSILRSRNIDVPLIADVHFSSDVAIEVAKVADKVRINPGNFAKEHDEACRQLKKFLEVCKEYRTAVRIGINHGSLGERIINKYGDTPLGMKEAAMEWIRMCEENDFHNLVISLKASNTIVMATAYRLLWKEMEKCSMAYPLHLGVTEAGNGDTGRIKSAVGIGALLKEGIGNTIRVSLTEDPVKEIPAGKIIANYFDSGEYAESIRRIGEITPGCIPHNCYDCQSWNEFIIKASCDFGPMLLDKEIDDFTLTARVGGQEIPQEKLDDFKDNLQQAARRKFNKPEYIACPGCGRTLYNLEETFNEVKRRTSHLKGVKIAIMGCIVNGPGEMADADFGYVGEGKGKVAIYKGKEPVMRSVPQEKAIDQLLRIIEENPLE
ncbi:MAG: (E)-4-hydroxy-3-methylbut-2-enyl-diphosphate synthase [Bacteroidales bacterium]|nr:(E)-4-hydroxy-3-methylbut-2-enyl-diphosphate synthase [Bacteroidales bacterium]